MPGRRVTRWPARFRRPSAGVSSATPCPCGIDARGLYAASPAEASVQRQLMDIADEVVLVVTREAFRTSAPARIAPLGRLTRLVTDQRPPSELSCALRRVGVVPHVVEGGAV